MLELSIFLSPSKVATRRSAVDRSRRNKTFSRLSVPFLETSAMSMDSEALPGAVQPLGAHLVLHELDLHSKAEQGFPKFSALLQVLVVLLFSVTLSTRKKFQSRDKFGASAASFSSELIELVPQKFLPNFDAADSRFSAIMPPGKPFQSSPHFRRKSFVDKCRGSGSVCRIL